MRIHTTAPSSAIFDAARAAGATLEDFSTHGSRKRSHAFDVHLSGSSRRRPNRRSKGDSDAYAATWDQWGVFFGHLYQIDPAAVCGWAYTSAEDFHRKTFDRFNVEVRSHADTVDGFPADAHGDHTFRYSGTPYVQACTKCSARQTWATA